MEKNSFEERVKQVAIQQSKVYKDTYVEYEYLICSDAFSLKEYYIIDAKEDNYQHLIGVNSLIKPKDFFEKCYNGTLEVTDFNFEKVDKKGKVINVKGYVRKKILVLHDAMNLFFSNQVINVEENFKKNAVTCNFATSDERCTFGFVDNTKARPKTLMKANKLNKSKMKTVDLVLRKKIGKDKFDEVVIGNLDKFDMYYEKIKELVDYEVLHSKLIKDVNIIDKETAIDMDHIDVKNDDK